MSIIVVFSFSVSVSLSLCLCLSYSHFDPFGIIKKRVIVLIHKYCRSSIWHTTCSSSHMASNTKDYIMYYSRSKGWQLKDPTFGNRTLCHATQTGEPSLVCQKISATTITSNIWLPNFPHYNPLIIMCGEQLSNRSPKQRATPKMNWRQG